MSSGDYVLNVNTSYTDSIGNKLIWSNDILSVFYYDTTSSGAEQNWFREWSVPNHIINNGFDLDEPGTFWELVTDDTSNPKTSEICRFANWRSTDLLMDQTVTSSGDAYPYYDHYVVAYNTSAGFESDDGVGYGVCAVTVDMGEVKDVNYVWFIPGFGVGSDLYKMTKDYRIGVSDTGTENDFSIVVSGTTISGSYSPVIEYVGDIQTRYIKLYIDDNWGHPTRNRLLKMSAFNDPDWSMYGYSNDDYTGGTDAYWQQTVDLSGNDYLFFDVRAHMASAAQVGRISIMASGIGGSTNDMLKDYTWSSTGSTWLDPLDNYGGYEHWTRLEERVDISSYTGDTDIKVRIYNDSSADRNYFFGYVDNLSTVPLWYKEEMSAYRGSNSAFPDEAYIISDREGLSIIDKASMDLWMRFQIGPGYILESAARKVIAKAGYIYLATTRGLIILDFVNNLARKLDDTGVYYRMSLGRRNEYALWYTESSSYTLPSNDVYAIALGEHSGDEFVLIGHGYGLTYVKTPNDIATISISNSNFTYPIKSLETYDDISGDVERVVYVGGYDSRARVGVMEDIASIKTTDFNDQTVFFSLHGLSNDMMCNSISDQWEILQGGVPITTTSGYATMSGIKSDYGNTLLIQKELTADKPFTASVDVKINKWPERGLGGLHFGVTSGWPVVPILYGATSQAMSLSAVNGVTGPVIENELVQFYPDTSNWILTLRAQDNSIVRPTSEGLLMDLALTGSYGSDYFSMNVFGHRRVFGSCDFTAKLKVRCVELTLSDSISRQYGCVFGISDGSYLGDGSGTHLLCMTLFSEYSQANPPVYAIGYTNSNDFLSFYTTSAQPLFSGDLTVSADWHQWEFTYDATTQTINASVDGLFVGEYQHSGMGSDIGIFFGGGGNNSAARAKVYFKDFEIDFGPLEPNAVGEYVLQTYDDGVYGLPTVSGTHLDGLPFGTTDGTSNALWKTWLIEYDGVSMSASVGGESVGSPVSLGLGNNNQRVFMYYNHPSLTSGTEDERDVDIKLKNFTIDYTGDCTLISGSPNSFWFESGTYLDVDYNSLYIATSSGVQRISYADSISVSGTPSSSSTFGVVGSGFGSAVLHGNINNVVSVEVESGAAGERGLLYTGSSRFVPRGWERLVDRTGNTDAGNEVGICVSPDGSVLYESLFSGSFISIYKLGTGVISSSWEDIAISDYPEGFGAINGSKAIMIDMQDGHLYVMAPGFFGIYSIKDHDWIIPEENITTDPIYIGLGIFRDQVYTPVYPHGAIFGLHYGIPTLLPINARYWTEYYRHATTNWWADESSCVYSDVDDSIYALRYGEASKFYVMPMTSLVFSDEPGDCPFPYNFTSGVSAFYRPYDESLYFIMKGATQSYGRRLLRFDIKEQSWYTWGEDFPAAAHDYMAATYAFEEDAIYVISGLDTANMYKYYFPRDYAERFVYWSAEDVLLPEDSIKARFRKISFDSNSGNYSDDLRGDSLSPLWFEDTYGAGGTQVINVGSEYTNFECSYVSSDTHASIVRAIPPQASSFTAVAEVRINDMARSTGEAAGARNMFVFGITDFLGTPGARSSYDGIEVGFSMVGVSGLFMIATNDSADDYNKYSLYKADLGSDTFYNTTQYENFDVTDATPSAQFAEWRIEYDHATKQLDAYIGGVSVGSVSLTGDGFIHGGSICLGAQRINSAVSGTIDVDVRELFVTASGSSFIESNYLKLNDDDEYGYLHYEKLDSTIISGTGYFFESDWTIDTYSVTDNEYVTSVGSMEDGNKIATVAALYTGDKKIGLYMGGDPTDADSYDTIEHDWTIRSTYKIVSDADQLNVYLNGAPTPAISVLYDNLPPTGSRRCRFGSINPGEEEFIWALTRNDHIITTSGSWALDTYSATFPVSYYGRNYVLPSTSNTANDKMIVTPSIGGTVYLYMFYPVCSHRTDAAPITVYHNGVLDIPSPDSFYSNPISAVTDNEDEYGNIDADATKVVVSQQHFADGSDYGRLLFPSSSSGPSGWVYLGKYIDITRIVVTSDGSGVDTDDIVCVDSFLLKTSNTQPRARSVSRVYSVGYTIGGESIKTSSDYSGGFTIVDMSTKTQIDSYSDDTSPSIADGNVSDFDVIQ